MGLLKSKDSSGVVEELETRRDGEVSQVAEFVSYLENAKAEAEKMLSDVDDARNRLDEVEEDAKSVKQFVESLPSFKGGEQ